MAGTVVSDYDRMLDIACAILGRPLFVDDAQADEDEAALAAALRVLAVLDAPEPETPLVTAPVSNCRNRWRPALFDCNVGDNFLRGFHTCARPDGHAGLCECPCGVRSAQVVPARFTDA